QPHRPPGTLPRAIRDRESLVVCLPLRQAGHDTTSGGRRTMTEHATTTTETAPGSGKLDAETISRIDAWWRAANYLSVGQIYLLDNPLLREPLTSEHIKPTLLGYWGTSPGQNFVYAHLNRAIIERDL